MSQLVITYAHAYVTGTTTLCAACADDPPDHIPALGPVNHGAHPGTCDGCEAADDGDHTTPQETT